MLEKRERSLFTGVNSEANNQEGKVWRVRAACVRACVSARVGATLGKQSRESKRKRWFNRCCEQTAIRAGYQSRRPVSPLPVPDGCMPSACRPSAPPPPHTHTPKDVLSLTPHSPSARASSARTRSGPARFAARRRLVYSS